MGANKLLPVEQVAGLSTPDNAYGVFVSEARTYVAGGLAGLRKLTFPLLPPRERSAIWKRQALPGVYSCREAAPTSRTVCQGGR